MKRLFLFIAIILFSIGLSGCDMISPQQVDEISEEFCRDNPTSEICQGDAVGTLEDKIILDVFNTILDEYNDSTNETFCEDYFSVTNTDLLDACRASRAGLIPENYIGFTVSDVTKKTTLSTEDIYEITVISEDLTVEIVFTIGLVNVEGIMYIDSWSFVETAVNPEDQEVSLEAAQAYFEQFLLDYLNRDILSSVICTEYSMGDEVSCTEDRNDSFSVNFTAVLNSIVFTDELGVFEVEMTFNDDEMSEPKIETEQIRFYYDEDGNIIMEFIDDGEGDGDGDGDGEPHPDDWLNAVDAFDVIVAFLSDYNGYDISNDDFNNLYFNGQMEWEFFQDRILERDKGVILSLVLVEEANEEPLEYLVVTMQRTFVGENKTMVVRLRVNDLGDNRYFFDILFENDGGLDYDMLWQFMEKFIEDYQDVTITDAAICEIYFNWNWKIDDPFNCVEDRQADLASSITITLSNLHKVSDYYEIEFEFDNGVDDPWYQTVYANFYFNEDNELVVEFNDLGFDEIDYYSALWFMENLVDDYSNYEMTSLEVCRQFFEGASYDECVIRREQEMVDGIVLNGFEIDHDGYGFFVEYFYSDSSGYEFSKHLEAYFYYNEDGELRLEFKENFGLLPYEEVHPFVVQLVSDFNSWGMDTTYLCNYYFGLESVQGCMDKRNEMITNNVTIGLSMMDMEYDHYRIEFEYSDSENNVWYETVNAYFWYDEYNDLKVDFKGAGPEQFPYDEAYAYFQQLINDFGDQDMLDANFCSLYFPSILGENCLWDRAILTLMNMDISLNGMDYDGHLFKAKVDFFNNYTSTPWTEVVYLEFFYDEYENIGMHLYDAPMNQYMSFFDSKTIIEQYVLDYMDTNITFNELNAWYFNYEMDYGFEEDRQESFDNGLSFFVFEIHDPHNADGQDFLEVLIDIYEYDVYVETMTIWMRVMPLGNGYHYLEVKDEHDQDYVDISYDDARQLMESFATDYADLDLFSFDVCSKYMSPEEYPMCMVKRDKELFDGIHVKLDNFDDNSDGFFADLGYYNNADEFMYSEYLQVFFYYGEREELKLSFNNYNYANSFPHDKAMQYINTLVERYIDTAITSSDYCLDYGRLFPDCETIRETVMGGSSYWYFSNFYNIYDNIFYFEYAYQVAGNVAAVYQGVELEFYYDEFGNMVVNIWNEGPNFKYATYTEAIAIYEDFINDYLDNTVDTQDLIVTYFNGNVDNVEPKFFDDRAADLISDITVGTLVFTDPNLGDGIDWIHVEFEVTKYGDVETITNNFRVIVYGPDKFELEMEHFNPQAINYPEAIDLLFTYVDDLLNTTMNDEDFCGTYTEGYFYDECLRIRSEYMGMYSSVQMYDFHYEQYIDAYQATLEFYDVDGVFMQSITYEIHFFYDNADKLRLELWEIYDNWDPLYADLHDMMLIFENEFMDDTIPSAEFCSEYFSDIAACATMRDEIIIGGLDSMWLEYFDWYPDCDDDGYCSDLIVYEAVFFYNLPGDTWLRQRVQVNPWYDNDGFLHVELVIIEEQTSVPSNAVLLDAAATAIVLDNFAGDYGNAGLSDDEFCALYFYGSPNCMPERQWFIDSGGNALFIEMKEMKDYDNDLFYLADFRLTIGSVEEMQHTPVRVYSLTEGKHYIEFVDYYLPVNPLDFKIATEAEALQLYTNFLIDYANITDYSDEYICQTYFQIYDPYFNCVEGRYDFVTSGKFITFNSIEEIYISDGDIYFRVMVDQWNPDGITFETITIEFYAYTTIEGDGFMMIIDSGGPGDPGIPDDPLFNELRLLLMDMPYDFVDPNISSVDFCAEYYDGSAECVTLREEIRSENNLSSLWLDDFWWYYDCDNTGYCGVDIMYEGILFFDFNDGTYFIQRVQVLPYYDIDNVLHIELVVIETQFSVPAGAVLLDYADTEKVLIQFALDYANPLLSEAQFCALYFAGAVDCVEGREEFLVINGTATFEGMLELLHDDGALYYEAEFLLTMNSIDDTQLAKLRVYLLVDTNHFIEFMHMDGPDDPDDPALALYHELNVVLMAMPDDFTDPIILSTDFCNEYFAGDADCIVLRDDILANGNLSMLWIEEFYWFYECDDSGVCDDSPSFIGYLLFDFDDGSYLRQRVSVTSSYDTDNNLHIVLTVTGTEISVPIGSVLLDMTEAQAVITEFARDYSNSLMSDEDFCALYFAGVPNCMNEREQDILNGMSFVFDTMTAMIDDYGIEYFAVEFLMTMGAITEVHTGSLRVWQVAPGEYFIEFIDQNSDNDPGDPGDMVIATYAEALLMYNNFLIDYELTSTYTDVYICEVYFHLVDTAFNCVEGRTEFVLTGGYNTFVSMTEIVVVAGDNFFEVTIDQYNPLFLTTETITYGFYAYVDPDGDVWMITITQAE